MDLISREAVKKLTKEMYLKVANTEYDVHSISDCTSYVASKCREYIDEHIQAEDLPSAFEGMTNNEVHKAIFGFELDPRYLVTDDTCICGENCPVCPLYDKTCNNQSFAEWIDSPYQKGDEE